MLHERGVGNAVATLGTALTMKHIRTLGRHAQKKIVYLFDGDAAGQRAADRALAFIDDSMTPEAGKSKVELCAVTLPDNLDPADFVVQRGPEALKALIADAQPLLQYGIDRRISAHDLSRPEGRIRALSEALAVLAPIKDSLLAKDYAVHIAGRVRAREEDVLAQLAQLQVPQSSWDSASRTADPVGDTAQPQVSRVQELSQSEKNRHRFEREFLGLLAQNPLIALIHADSLAQIQWHDELHSLIAQSLLDTLIEDPAASSGALVTNATRLSPLAADVLTSASVGEGYSPDIVAEYLAEELSLGDVEEALEMLKAQLSDPRGIPLEEQELLFESVVGMQMDLTHRRLAHKPLAPPG